MADNLIIDVEQVLADIDHAQEKAPHNAGNSTMIKILQTLQVAHEHDKGPLSTGQLAIICKKSCKTISNTCGALRLKGKVVGERPVSNGESLWSIVDDLE